MGDYNKLIVNCSIKKTEAEDLEKFKVEVLDKIYLSSSAYQCGGCVFHIDNDWNHRTDIILVTQTKYGRRIPEFLDWLAPQVIQGCGDKDAWAMEWSEYQKEPTIRYMEKGDE